MRKLVVVTGGSMGIGRAIIEKFLEKGFDAATCSRNARDLEALKIACRKRNPDADIFFRQTDMSVKAEVQAFAQYVLSLERPVDVLVNNAGFFVPGDISNEPDGNLESMINANLYSAYHMTRGLVSDMIKKQSGHIFNMCSIASFQAYKNGGSYAISKFALLGFSKCLREELKSQSIRVTAVMPGATKTRSWGASGLPDDRFIRPEDVADAVFGAWSLSPQSVVEEIIIRPQEGDI
jgi:short-subunit dehydrogenase